jgi:serine/threonine-protein kinase
MAPVQDPLVGKVLMDRFEILSRIGEGGTGVVYKAKQIAVDRTVAIKILGAHVSQDPTWVKRFHNEARAAAKLDHPNTVRLIDFGETKEGLLFIAMEFLQGRSLAEEIARIGRLPPQRVLRILMQICQSLQEAHAQGIIHRDIKPENVFLLDMKGSGDFVKVLDFSVAKMETGDANATRAGVVFGTPAYMSPEQGAGRKLTPQSDLYSCGIVAYEMLTGRPPFEGRLPMEVVIAHQKQRPAPLLGFPDPLQNLVMRALEKQPERRQQSAEEMIQECQACLDQLFPRASGVTGAVGSAVTEGRPVVGTPATGGLAPPPMAPPPMAPQMAPPPMAPPPMAPPPMAPPPAQQAMPPPNAPPVQTAPEARTVMAQAPSLPVSMGAQVKTQFMQAPNLGAGVRTQAMDGTVLVDQPMGLSAAALAARQLALTQSEPPPTKTSPLFWVGWAMIGLSLGLALHFFWPHGVS